MVKPPRNQKGVENPIKKWWWCCGKCVNKGGKRFEDLIQTIANGEEEGCGDDETKWKRIVSNKHVDYRIGNLGFWVLSTTTGFQTSFALERVSTSMEHTHLVARDEARLMSKILGLTTDGPKGSGRTMENQYVLQFFGAPFRLCVICGRRWLIKALKN